MSAIITHTPKTGALLTGVEYEATDHHVVSGVALDSHDHDGTYATVAHTHASAAMILVQAADPGAVGAGVFWLSDSGLAVRNDADDGWLSLLQAD